MRPRMERIARKLQPILSPFNVAFAVWLLAAFYQWEGAK